MIDYSKAKAFADANKNIELQKGKMEPQAYSEIKMALEELEGFCAINPTKELLDVYKEYYEMNFNMQQERHNKILSDAQKFSEAQHESDAERTETLCRIHERIDQEKQQFTELHKNLKDLLHLEGFFDRPQFG